MNYLCEAEEEELLGRVVRQAGQRGRGGRVAARVAGVGAQSGAQAAVVSDVLALRVEAVHGEVGQLRHVVAPVLLDDALHLRVVVLQRRRGPPLLQVALLVVTTA